MLYPPLYIGGYMADKYIRHFTMADIWRIILYMKTKYPALTRAKIPFEITHSDSLLKWLMKIAEARPFLDEYIGTPQEVKLLRRAKIKAVTYSNQIEGNHLSELDVSAVLNGKKIKGSAQDIKEIGNYRAALDYVEQIAKEKGSIRKSDFYDIQRLVTKDLLPEKQIGKIRTIPVSIVNSSTKEIIEACPEPHLLKDLVDELWVWLDDTTGVNPFLRAFAFHFIAVSIHPFADGNGRSVRLMQHLLLLKGGESIARLVPSETVIMRERDRYYSTLRQSRALNSLTPILEFLAECFALSAQDVVKEGKALLKEKTARKPNSRKDKILKYARGNSSFTAGDIVSFMSDIPRRTIERDLALLVKEKLLVATGENKARVYKMAATTKQTKTKSK